MNLKLQEYNKQKLNWPSEGRHILAQYTKEYVVVYQAYKPSIGLFAASNQFFGGDFSYSRMSWIKTNFLWMMYRSGWGTKEGQEITLAIKLKREYFESILLNAVNASYDPKKYSKQAEWKKALQFSDVRLQWDPDHKPNGNKEIRRAVQLGLRNEFLEPFKGDGILEVEDISEFVKEQRTFVLSGNLEKLITPSEEVYVPINQAACANVGVD